MRVHKALRAGWSALPTLLVAVSIVGLMTARVTAEQPDDLDNLATFLCAQHDGVQDLRVAPDTDTPLIGTWSYHDHRDSGGTVRAPGGGDGWTVFAVSCRDGHEGMLSMRWLDPLPEEEAIAAFKVRLQEERQAAIEEARAAEEARTQRLLAENAARARQRILQEHGESVQEIASVPKEVGAPSGGR